MNLKYDIFIAKNIYSSTLKKYNLKNWKFVEEQHLNIIRFTIFNVIRIISITSQYSMLKKGDDSNVLDIVK